MGQTSNAGWYNERLWRITASRFGEIARITARRNIRKLCESLIERTSICTKAIAHGKTYEGVAIRKFEEVRPVFSLDYFHLLSGAQLI